MAGSDVFVSYNTKDASVTRRVVELLREKGLQPWVAWERLPAGQAWSPKIRNVIKNGSSALIFVGAHGLGPWQKREVSLCLAQRRRGMPLIPVILPGTPEDIQVPWSLKELSWISLDKELSASAIENLISALQVGHQPRSLKVDSPAKDASPGSEPSAERSQSRTLAYQFLIQHLAEAGDTERLFSIIEDKGFLADKADYFSTFHLVIDDLENHILPMALRAGDWKRFLVYTLASTNLRNLSENLGEPRVLTLLLENGQHSLAKDLARRAPSEIRLEIHAIIAASHDRSGEPQQYSSLLDLIADDLDSLPPPQGAPDARIRANLLAKIAYHLGLEFLARHEEFLIAMEAWPELKSEIWIAAAKGYLARGADKSYFWEAVRRIEDSRALAGLLPRSIIEAAEPLAPDQVLDDLGYIPVDDDRVFWHTWMASLARKARYDPQGCLEL